MTNSVALYGTHTCIDVLGASGRSGFSEEVSAKFEKYMSERKFDKIKKDYKGLEVDDRVILLHTPPIRFARMKIADLRAVSE